jgi:hypothetical protein
MAYASLNGINAEFGYGYHPQGQEEETAAGCNIPVLMFAGGKEEVLFVFEPGKWKVITVEENGPGPPNAPEAEFLMAETLDVSTHHHLFRAGIAEKTAMPEGNKEKRLRNII